MISYIAADRPFGISGNGKASLRHALRRKRRAKAGASLMVTPPLLGGPYVFPVAGEVGFTDTYGALRSDVPGGWHHGDDLFSAIGQPVLAVADGTVFSVGWNRIGGWRLWLRDRQGNEFYYAHLSGYTKLARNGEQVTAGQPLAFVGNTGDAITTPHHLHFEIHPVSLLARGYDGAVNPTSYLESWRRPEHVDPRAPVRLPAGAASHGDGALSDYWQLLAARGIRRPTHRQAAPRAIFDPLSPFRTVLSPDAIVAAPPSASAPGGSLLRAVVAGFAAFAAVAALLLRRHIPHRRSATRAGEEELQVEHEAAS